MNSSRIFRASWLLVPGCLMLGAALLACRPTTGQQAVPPTKTVVGAPALPKAVASTHDLMELFSEPLYEVLKTEMEQTPSTDVQWKSLATRGIQTSEIANLIALRNPKEEWQEHAQELHLAGLQLTKVANEKDWRATISAYQGVVQQCNACHHEFAGDDAPRL